MLTLFVSQDWENFVQLRTHKGSQSLGTNHLWQIKWKTSLERLKFPYYTYF